VKAGPAALLAATALALCGCAGLSAADRAPRTDPVARLTTATPSPWTDSLGDPALADLLARADAGSLDVKAALGRLERADAEAAAAEAAGRLQVNVGAVAAIGGRNFSSSARSAATPTLETTLDLDVWHRFARGRKAASQDRAAAAWDVDAARLMVAAETVRTYAALQAARGAEAAAQRRRDAAGSALGLVRLRVSAGAASGRDLDPRAHDAATADAALQQARAEVALQAARLGDLTGQHDLAPPPAAPVPVPAAPAPAASAQVDGRPDVKAAYARLAAADQRRAAAVLAARPNFQIAAALGSPDAAIATLLDVRALAWAVAGTITHEILDGGARRAQVHIASAEADIADLAYRQAVLTGWSEIRTALAGEAEAARQLAIAQSDLTAARAALRTGETRHAAGAADGLAIAALAGQVESVGDALRQARVAAIDAHVRRVLATGGA
jgi:multidrug efflux system outer membrane protein